MVSWKILAKFLRLKMKFYYSMYHYEKISKELSCREKATDKFDSLMSAFDKKQRLKDKTEKYLDRLVDFRKKIRKR